jgi:hypothetical protein
MKSWCGGLRMSNILWREESSIIKKQYEIDFITAYSMHI